MQLLRSSEIWRGLGKVGWSPEARDAEVARLPELAVGPLDPWRIQEKPPGRILVERHPVPAAPAQVERQVPSVLDLDRGQGAVLHRHRAVGSLGGCGHTQRVMTVAQSAPEKSGST